MKQLAKDYLDLLIDALTTKTGRDIGEALELMIENGYSEEQLIRMPIGDILDYYDNYYKPNKDED